MPNFLKSTHTFCISNRNEWKFRFLYIFLAFEIVSLFSYTHFREV